MLRCQLMSARSQEVKTYRLSSNSFQHDKKVSMTTVQNVDKPDHHRWESDGKSFQKIFKIKWPLKLCWDNSQFQSKYSLHAEWPSFGVKCTPGSELCGSCVIVSYLTQVSDLDLAPNLDQFVASPPVRYINSGCCVNFSMCLWTPYKGVLGWLKFDRGEWKKLKN